MEQGTAYHMTNRKKIDAESQKEQDEAERITIVGFDTSGSMVGELAEFQAALITAFACRAIDDVTASGRHRHKVLLVPFDDEVGTPMKINNIEDVLGLIGNYRDWLRNTGGGTEIQKFLLQAMSLVAEAQITAKSTFDIANIIVMSDGESPIDYQELRKARNAIHRDTPLQAMFVALGSTNPELKRFAQEAKNMGMDSQDLYRSFSEGEISSVISKSKQNDSGEYEKAFYSLTEPKDIVQSDRSEIIKIFKTVIEKTKQLEEKTLTRITPFKEIRDHKKDLSDKTNSAAGKTNYQEREVEGWIQKFREWMEKHEIHKDSKLFELVLDDLMNNFEETVGVKFEDLGYYELGQLNHLLEKNN
jgi:uncharacterized protein with von Willebrand factor type A (vWA) domain